MDDSALNDKTDTMEPFLQNVAQRIWAEHKHDIERVIVVFNNRRAGLFLVKQLRELGDKPFFLPEIIGIDDLVSRLGKQQIVPHEFLLFELFDIHRSLEGVERRFETFEEFISFGEMMIGDFSEIDLYCVDAARLFSHIHEHKRLGEWDVSGKPLTPFQEKYLNFYNSLFVYYSRLRQRLGENKQAYTGMAYRNVAENIDSLIGNLDCSHIYFVGFNALSASEARIVDCFVKNGIGTLICDGDDYYFKDLRQEAGYFLRNNAKKHTDVGNFGEHFAQGDREIHIINCPENIQQAKAAGKIIGQLMGKKDENENKDENKGENKAQDTAIILADESLLLPVLNSLPQQVKTTNVTMGFPYALTNVHNLANKILSLYCNCRSEKFYHVDITNIVSDTLISKYFEQHDLYSRITKLIYKQKIIRATKDDIALFFKTLGLNDDLLFLFDNAAPTASEAMDIIRRLFTLLSDKEIFGENTKEKESLACFIQILNYLDELQLRYKFIERIDTLQKIYLRLAQRRTVPFYGEPLEGLQILGMLETRSLDFSNIIILSLNEGTMPAGRNTNSLIPLSLKTQYHIPAFKEKDAVYAYNFYRLLQRAKNVWLLYSSDAEGIGKGEASRFILQTKDELAVRYPNIKIHEEVAVAYNKAPATVENTAISKDERTMRQLIEMAQSGLSPSALNRYRGCPMQFFYGYVLNVKENEEVSEELEANELGSYIHEILRDIYLRDSDHIVKAATLEQALGETAALVDSTFKSKVLKGRSDEGKNHLYCEVAKMQISAFLKKEIEILKNGTRIEISLVEEQMTIPLALANNTANQVVNIEGIADRIDLVDGQMRIADYKSGRVKSDELAVADPTPDPNLVPDKWFQVMTYAWLYCRKHHYTGNFTAGIFPLGTLSSGFMPASWEKNAAFDASHIDRFEELLTSLLSEIMDPTTPFIAKPDKDRCAYCPYARICDKKTKK